MAIAAFKMKMFDDAKSLQDYVVSVGGGVTTVTAIVFDAASGKFVLFYV